MGESKRNGETESKIDEYQENGLGKQEDL